MNTGFNPWPHGDHTIGVRNNVMEISALGPFNIQEVKRFGDNVDSFFPSLTPPWAELVIFESPGLFTPDAMEALTGILPAFLKAGLSAVAIVVKDSTSYPLVKHTFDALYKGSGLIWEYHRSSEKAWDWLLEWQKSLSRTDPAI